MLNIVVGTLVQLKCVGSVPSGVKVFVKGGRFDVIDL